MFKRKEKELLATIEGLEERIARILAGSDLGLQLSDGQISADSLFCATSLLTGILDAIPEPLYIKDNQGKYLFSNRAHRAWFGNTPCDCIQGKTDFDLFPHELAARYATEERALLRTARPLVGREEPVAWHDKSMHWVSTTKVPIRSPGGDIVALVGISRDISAAKSFENALMHERQLLYTLLDNVPDSIYFKDARSRFIRVNRAWASRRGITDPHSVVGKTDFDYFPEVLARRYHQDEQTILQTATPLVSKIEKIELPQTSPRWISITKVPVFDDNGRVAGTCGISRDITTLIKTEEELAHERDLLLTLMEYSTDFIYFKDRQSRFVRLNRAHAQWLGYSTPEELIGKSDFDVHSPEHARDAFDDEQEIIRTATPLIGKIENESCPTHPEERWAMTSKGPLFDKEKNILGTFGISRDITRIKQYERELQRSNDELEHRVAARTADLLAANERLETRLEQLDFLNTTTYEMAQFIHLDELLPAIMSAFASRFAAAAASLCLHTEGGFTCRALHGLLDNDAGRGASQAALHVFLENSLQRPYFSQEWRNDDHLALFDWPAMPHLTAYAAIPLLADNRTVAIVQLFLDNQAARRYPSEEKVLATLAAQGATCLSNALRYIELGHSARLAGELDAAHAIQQSFTPRYRPSINGVDLKGIYCPAFEVGGDYLDYFRTSGGDWVVIIADVCGKGIPAAILMAVLRSAVRVEARDHTSARELLVAVNRAMRSNLDDQSFITALCCVISSDGARMTYARAGHPLLLKINTESNAVELIEVDGIALGLVADTDLFATLMGEVSIELRCGDRYLLYTDGLTEAWDEEKNCYGVERLSALLQTSQTSTPDSILDLIMNDIKSFANGAAYHDDLTLLALQVTPRNRPPATNETSPS